MVSNHAPRRIGRRTYLAAAGGALASLGAVGTAGAASIADDYGTVVDVVDEGAANDGSESVSSVVADCVDNDTLVRFPPGRYYFDEQVRLTDFWNLGLVGEDATLVPAPYDDFDGPQYRLFRLGTNYAPGDSLRVENFTVDQTAPETGIRAFEAQVANHLVVRDVDVVGRHDSGTWGPGLFTVTDPDGSGLVERFSAPDGAAANPSTPGELRVGPTGVLCNQAHAGTIRFVDCELGAFPDNGLYAAGGTGHIVVEGGRYANSGTASIRVGATRCDVRDVTVVVDAQPWDVPQEGIRLDYGDWHVVDGVTVELERPSGEGIHVQDSVGGATIRNTDLRVERPAHVGVQVDPGAGPTYLERVGIEMNDSNSAVLAEGDDPGEVGLADVTVTGDATGDEMRHAVRCERDRCSLRNVTVEQLAGDDRRGLALLGRNYFVYDCRFETSHRPLTVKGDDVWIQACYANSTHNVDSIRLYESANDVRLKDNEFPDTVNDDGATNVVETGTTY